MEIAYANCLLYPTRVPLFDDRNRPRPHRRCAGFWPAPLKHFLFSGSILYRRADRELYLLDEKRNDADTVIRSGRRRSWRSLVSSHLLLNPSSVPRGPWIRICCEGHSAVWSRRRRQARTNPCGIIRGRACYPAGRRTAAGADSRKLGNGFACAGQQLRVAQGFATCRECLGGPEPPQLIHVRHCRGVGSKCRQLLEQQR